jgi:DHA3 family macrolide efflux protein-like MFS transporter
MEKLTGWRGFLAVWAGQSISLVGSGMYAFAVGVFIYERTHSATLFGLILFFEMLPGVLIAPYAGVVADRVNRRTVMLAGNAGMIAGALVVLLATMHNHINFWELYPALVIGSVFAQFHAAAYDSSIVLLMPESRWNRANGLVQLGEAIANVSAPLAAGTLLIVLHIWGLILLDIATFGVAFVALLVLKMPDLPATAAAQENSAQENGQRENGQRENGQPEGSQPEGSQREGDADAALPESPKRLRDDLRYGWRFIRASRGLPAMLATFSLLSFFVNIAVVAATPLVLSFTNSAEFGVVAAAGGAGMVVGGLVMVVWKGPAKRVPLMLAALCGTGIFIALYGIRPSALLVGVGQFGFFFCLPIANAPAAGIWQRRVPAEAQGRVFAVRRMLARVTVPIAILIAGPLIDHVFKPLLTKHGSLAGSLGPIFGTGPGRGIGLLFVLLGLAMLITTLIGAANPGLRAVEDIDPVLPVPASSAAAAGGA